MEKSGCLAAFLGGLGLLVVLALGSWWNLGHPGTSREAHHLEDVLREIPIGDMTPLGLHLVAESSTAGAEASGFMADSPNDPAVRRTYRYQGEIAVVCEAIRSELQAAGWTEREPSKPCFTYETEVSRVTLTRQCVGLTAYAEISVYGPQVTYTEPSTASIRVSTQYPDTPARAEYAEPTPRDRDTTSTTARPHC